MKERVPIPERTLPTNFTKQTLRRAMRAKKRLEYTRRIERIFSMKKSAFLTKPAGAMIAVALAVTGSAGAYAAINWFNGDVAVKSDSSIMTVDLSQCKNTVIPGADMSDPKNVRFKVTGQPHISADDLREDILANCERTNVSVFYNDLFPNQRIGVEGSVIKAINGDKITLDTMWGGAVTEKTLRVNSNTKFFNQSKPSSMSELHVGDFVAFAFDVTATTEGVNDLDSQEALKSIFKTAYDVREHEYADSKGENPTTPSFYEKNNITPLQ